MLESYYSGFRRKARVLKAETYYAKNRCDMSPRQVATTNRLVWHVKIFIAATEFCRCDLSNSDWFEFVRHIAATKWAQAALS